MPSELQCSDGLRTNPNKPTNNEREYSYENTHIQMKRKLNTLHPPTHTHTKTGGEHSYTHTHTHTHNGIERKERRTAVRSPE
jgi:hypothetical protein